MTKQKLNAAQLTSNAGIFAYAHQVSCLGLKSLLAMRMAPRNETYYLCKLWL